MVALDNSGTDYQDTCKSSVKNDEDNNVKPRDAYQPNGKGKAIDKKPNDSLNQHADMNKLKEKGDMLFELKRFEEAIECYIKLEDLIAQNIHVYFKIGDCLTALKNNEASKWYNKGLNWQPNDSNVAVIYSLLWTATPQTRPASIQLDLIRRIIPFKPISYIYEELEILGKNFEQYFPITNDNMYNTESIYSLISLLYHLPEAHQGQALSVLTQQQTQRIASLLIQLQSAKLVGLTPLTTNIVRSWNHCQDNIKTATNFWKTFQHYEVSQQDADLFKARHNMLRKKYSVAEPLLQRIIEHHPSETEAIWSLIEIQSYLHNPLHTQYKLSLEFLYYEKNNVERRFEAMRILDNILTKEKNCLTVTQWIAEMQVGIHDTPLIQEYRKGNWDSIPTLRNHSDYVFPTVIVIDIENDYQPTATPGSCLIEVGAVRIKGNTELATYNAVIQRNFIAQKVANRQAEARDVQVVANELSNFINETYDPQGPVILVGHNLATVDAIHLRAIGIDIRDEQIIDTLAFARLLYPDRLRHNLKEMCDLHHINLDEAHNALPDAQANAHLLYALGEEVVNNRSHLLPGFRAFVREGSAFDRAILQPRRVVVDPTCDWQLTPTPSPMTSRVYKKTITSSELSIDLQQTQDCIVEYTHSSATYMNMLPSTRTILITVGSRARIEHLVANEQDNQECYILPNIYTLLCAKRLQQKIIEEPRPEIQLQLYCLYQASHNHDARTLYPFRLPLTSLVNQTKEDQDLRYIKDILSSTYCTHHTNQQCETWKQTKQAIVQKRIILATHEIFLNYKLPKRDTIIIDDLDELQMHIGEYEAQKFLSENLRQDHPTLFTILNDAITMYCTPEPGQEPGQKRIHTRIPLSYVAPLFISIDGEQETGLLTKIREQGKIGQRYAKYLEIWCRKAYEEQKVSERVQAQWLDVYYSDTDTPNNTKIESWSFCSIDANIPEVFHTKFWNPYTQHILCGHALFQGTTQVQSKSLNMTFLERFFDLPKNLPRRQHQTTHTRSALYIPDDKQIQPASFLAHYAWIESVGDFLYQNIAISQRSFVITLHEQRLLHALVNTFKEVKMVQSLPQHIISTKQGYHLRKISEILSDHNQSTITFLSPSQRKYMADIPADIEASGPLRFINQRDPLVVAQLRSFKARFPKEQPFTSYILPQAILELKARISTPSKLHIILDSSLHSTIYYEEVQAVLKDICDFVELPVTSQQGPQKEQFKNIYAKQLEQQGYNQHVKVTDEELHNVLKNAWNTNQFRQTPLDQKTIVKNILNNQDQMVIAATGGGKSLCYQLPAILLSQDYLPRITLVISPLIALMRDQVHALQQKGIFSSVSLDSMQNSHEQINYLTGIRRGDYSIIYASPERIRSDAFVRALQGRTIGLIAFDEAHCISEWGHDFRTDYLAISHWIDEKICKQERKFPIVALTATARKGYAAPQEEQKDRKQASYKAINKGTIEDIHEKLKLKCDLAKFVPPSPERKELEFHVIHIEHCPICDHKLEIRLGDVQCPMCKAHLVIDYKSIKKYIKEVKLRRLVDLLTGKDQPNLYQRWNKTNYKERQRGIIYCRTKKDIQKICEYLKELPELADLRTGAYHGSLDDEEKQETYEKFICDDQNGLDIIVATKAFGMGIDVRRLGFVIHFDIPSSPEAYYQEAGRAGRDDFFQEGRDRAQCILLYHEDDIQIQHYFLTKNTIDNDHIETLYNVLNQHRTNGQQEILVTANELALPAGLQEEEVNSILYYLEYQTKAGIHRTSITTNGWQLQFEVDYRQHLASLIEPEQQLLTCFQQDPDFQLNENMTTIIQARELAEKLGWQIADVKRRKKQLIHKGIIAQSSHVNIYWKQDQQDSRENLTSLFEALENICNLQQWDDKGNINQAHTITEKHIADTLKSSHPQVKISQFKKLLTLDLARKNGVSKLGD